MEALVQNYKDRKDEDGEEEDGKESKQRKRGPKRQGGPGRPRLRKEYRKKDPHRYCYTKVNIMRIDECLRDHPCNLVCLRTGTHEFIKCSRCLVVDSWLRDAPHHLD